ncbi:enoyl-CoA hydratase-related protein [Niabella terrae]
MYKTLLYETVEKTAIITINRPEKLNALNRTVFDELEICLDQLLEDPEIRSAILTGKGEKAFVAGADISEFSGLDAAQAEALSRRGQQVFDKIARSPKIILAAVNGFALGGGCELAMACHFRLAAESARFGQPEVNLGLLPGYGGTQRLVELIGKGRALELLATGNMIDAVTAFNYGLVNHVVPQQELLLKARSILALVNSKAPGAVAACIQAVTPGQEDGYALEARLFGELLQGDDALEGIAAFLEKRKPVFKGQ